MSDSNISKVNTALSTNKTTNITQIDDNPRESFIGCAKGMFEIPEDFEEKL